MAKKFSFFKSVKNDYILMISLILMVVFWVLYFAVEYFGFIPNPRRGTVINRESSFVFLYMGIGCLVVFGPLFIYRLKTLLRIFNEGQYSKGKVTFIAFFRDRGRIEFVYDFQGKEYQKGIGIMKNADTKNIQQGDEIEVVIDRNNHKRAFITRLYSAAGPGI